jgi:hypothetical protein
MRVAFVGSWGVRPDNLPALIQRVPELESAASQRAFEERLCRNVLGERRRGSDCQSGAGNIELLRMGSGDDVIAPRSIRLSSPG